MKTPENTMTFSDRFEKYIYEKGLSNEEMFKCLNILFEYSGVKTIRDYAEENNISVQSVYQYKPVKQLLNRKVVFDNI